MWTELCYCYAYTYPRLEVQCELNCADEYGLAISANKEDPHYFNGSDFANCAYIYQICIILKDLTLLTMLTE
jgi:hypothetical protein